MTGLRNSARSVRPSILIAAVPALLLLGSACGGEEGAGDEAAGAAVPAAGAPAVVPSGPEAITPEMIALGQTIFQGQAAGGICFTCHGPDATGGQLGPNLTDDEWIHGDGGYDFIVGVINAGIPNPQQYPGPMPPFGRTMTPEQVHAVAAYVYSLSHDDV